MAGPLIAVWSPKGGVGKTVISAGLGMHLVRRCPRGALLIDLDVGKADISPLLKTSLRPSILDYAAGAGRTVVHPTGLHILPGPPRLVDAGLVTEDLTEAVLRRAINEHAAVVADVDSDLVDSTVIALEKAGAVLLVTTPDLLSLYACRRFTQEAEMIGLSLAAFRLVINRATPQQEIPDREILDLIGVPLAGRIPDLPGMSAAINRGMISTTVRTNTELAVALHRIADKLSFSGLPPAPIARAKLGEKPVGTILALRRWWQSL